MKKFLAIAVAMLMVLAMSTAVFAQATPGSVTVHNPVYGHTYTGYKIFDATYNGSKVSYTIDRNSQFYADVVASNLFDLVQVGSTNTYTVAKKTGIEDAAIISWLQGLSVSGKTVDLAAQVASAQNPTIVWSDVPYGYYLIVESDGQKTGISVDTANPAAVIYDKISTPGFDGNGKEVWDSTEQTWGKFSQAQIGDTVQFRITAHLPEYVDGTEVQHYVFTDTMGAGFTLVANSYAITFGGQTYNSENMPAWLHWNTATNDNGDTVITITVDAAAVEPYPGDPSIVITYSATVDNDAEVHNYNNVGLTWDGEPVTPPTPTDTQVGGIDVIKTDGTNELSGAQFVLYDALTGGNRIYVTLVETVNGVNYYEVTTTPNEVKIDAGHAVIFGLDLDKTYYLEETQAPAGYNPLTARQPVTPGFTVGEGNTVTYPSINVVNNFGSELPHTGGIGTTIFYVVGGLMMAAAVVLLVTRKKMSVED